MVIGQQKGRDTKEKFIALRMPKPEGYRKALRLMRLCGKIQRAFNSLHRYAGRVTGHRGGRAGPVRGYWKKSFCTGGTESTVICTVIGEGGSGGRAGSGGGDLVQMLQYATYSVIPPRVAHQSCGRAQTRRQKLPR